MHWNIIILVWIAGTQLIWFIVESRRQKWWAFMFLKKESLDSLEHKIFSFNEALIAKFITDEYGVISNINIAAWELFRYKKAEIVGNNLSVIIPKTEHDKLRQMFDKLRGEPMEKKTFLLNAVDKYGIEIPVEIVLRKKQNKDNFFYLVMVIDRRKEVQTIKKYEQVISILKLKNDILSKGEEIGGTGSWLWELGDKNEMTVSDGYKKILGIGENENYSANEIRKRVWDEDEPIVSEALEKAFGGKPYDIQYRMKRMSDFRLIFIRSIVKPILDKDGVVTHLYGSTRLLQTYNITIEKNINLSGSEK